MPSSVDGPPSLHLNNTNNNNNTNSSSESSGNSGSQYALCALGVGLVALGIVMIVWSVVPAGGAANSSTSSAGDGDVGRKNKASSVAFVLVGSGVVILLLSLCLGLRNKQQEQLRRLEAQNRGGAAASVQQETETAEEQAQRFAVPSYEEAVGSGQYPVGQSNPRQSTSQLPSYDDLVQVDGVQYETEVTNVSQPASIPGVPTAAASTSNRRPGKNSRKLLPIKIRRIKSEKLRMKNTDQAQSAAEIGIEPLTPPPQYEDKVPPI
ncbi:transmembrane protein 51a [Brachionichthys hirsutus]|uniref:transmembrane protein 51a n=1 Tax=Brachionichthys hirsutus TaxID=412623 RepID=UPI003604E098